MFLASIRSALATERTAIIDSLMINPVFWVTLGFHPLGNLPLHDDWLYALTVRHLVEAGDFRPTLRVMEMNQLVVGSRERKYGAREKKGADQRVETVRSAGTGELRLANRGTVR